MGGCVVRGISKSLGKWFQTSYTGRSPLDWWFSSMILNQQHQHHLVWYALWHIWNSFGFLLYTHSLFLENYCTWLLRYRIFVWGGTLEINLFKLSYLSVCVLCVTKVLFMKFLHFFFISLWWKLPNFKSQEQTGPY